LIKKALKQEVQEVHKNPRPYIYSSALSHISLEALGKKNNMLPTHLVSMYESLLALL